MGGFKKNKKKKKGGFNILDHPGSWFKSESESHSVVSDSLQPHGQ